MEKSYKSLIFLLFSVYIIKMTAMGASLPDSIISLTLGSLFAFLSMQRSDKNLADVHNKINSLQEDIAKSKKNYEEINTFMSGMKLNGNYTSIRSK